MMMPPVMPELLELTEESIDVAGILAQNAARLVGKIRAVDASAESDNHGRHAFQQIIEPGFLLHYVHELNVSRRSTPASHIGGAKSGRGAKNATDFTDGTDFLNLIDHVLIRRLMI